MKGMEWEWGMGNGEWGMGNGEWGMGNGDNGIAEWGEDSVPFTPYSPSPLPLYLSLEISSKYLTNILTPPAVWPQS